MDKIKETLTQGDLELWLVCIRTHKPKGASEITMLSGNLPAPEHFGVAVRAAADAGWYQNGFKAEQVSGMSFQEVAKMGKAVWAAYMDATTFDPNE